MATRTASAYKSGFLKLLSLSVLVIGLSAGVIGVQHQQLSQTSAFVNVERPQPACQFVPKGSYKTTVTSAEGMVTWAVKCGSQNYTGGLDLKDLVGKSGLNLGAQNVPVDLGIGQAFNFKRTMAQICQLSRNSSTLCRQVCSSVDCTRINLEVATRITSLRCLGTTAYNLTSAGKATLQGSAVYQGVTCTGSGSGSGIIGATLTRSVVGIQ